jgi:uncharacterized protein (DUF1499 family)
VAIGFKWVVGGLAPVVLVGAVLLAAQLGLLRGSPKAVLGVSDGRLAQPSITPNSVSSQASLYPEHPQLGHASIEPFRPAAGESLSQTWLRLTALVRETPDVVVISEEPAYLRAEASTRWLRFVDDVELLRSDAEGVIHVRSASRLGRKDFGVNRHRVEGWRAALGADASRTSQ